MENIERVTMTEISSNLCRFGADSSFYVLPPEPAGTAAVQAVSASLFQRTRSSIERAADESDALSKVVTNWRAALDDQVGSDTWKQFLDFSTRQRQSKFGLEDRSPGQVDPDRITAARKKAQARSIALIEEARVDREALQRIHARAEEEFLQSLGPPDIRQLEVVREEEVPTAVREGKTNPWFVKNPPYDGWYWKYEWETVGSRWISLKHNIEVLEDPFTYISGQFGHYSCYENFSAGDTDKLKLNFMTEVGFWYKPTKPGHKKVWVKILCKKARADVYLEDEWGWSSSKTRMRSRLYFNLAQVPGLEGQTGYWYFYVKGSPDSKWYHFDWIAPETILWVPFAADFPPGWVYIAIGADDRRKTSLNDVSTHQAMDSRYSVEQVWIED